MSIFEYDQEKHMHQELIQKKLDKGMPIAEIAADLEETEEHIRKIIADNKDFVHDKGDIRYCHISIMTGFIAAQPKK